MNQPNNQNQIDPRQLAKNAKVVIQAAPAQQKKVTIPAGKLQGLGSMPKPTQNPPAKPEQNLQGPTVIQGPTTKENIAQVVVEKAVNGDMKATELLAERDLLIPPVQKEMEKNGRDEKTGQFKEGYKGGPGRPKKSGGLDKLYQAEMDKQHGIRPDGSVVTKAEMIATKLIEKAVDGDLKAIEIVSNRIDGKPMQKIQVIPPEDAAGTVVSKEDEERLEAMFGR